MGNIFKILTKTTKYFFKFQTVCSHQSIGGPIVRVIPIRMKFQSASDSCRKLGGRMFSPIKDKKNLKGIYDMGLKHDTFPTCKTDFWTPFRRFVFKHHFEFLNAQVDQFSAQSSISFSCWCNQLNNFSF